MALMYVRRAHRLSQIRVLIWAAGWYALRRGFGVHSHYSQLGAYLKEGPVAPLRVPVYKLDVAAFGDNIPVVLRQYCSPHTTSQAKAVLRAGLEALTLSTILPILGKQWSNRYAPVDVRWSAVESGQSR